MNSFCHRNAADQAETCGAAKRAEMANIEQIKKIVPLITCESPFRQHVCDLVFDVDVTDLNFWDPDWSCQTTNLVQLCGFVNHVSLWDFL